MKIIMIMLVLSLTRVYGQNNDHKVLLDSAKKMFKNTDGLYKEELYKEELYKLRYAKIAAILEKVIELKPDNVEARYFLGYTYSRVNSRDGSSMIDTGLELVKKASEQFEKINKQTPKYEGEKIVNDPYSKISSEWGSLAVGYMYNNKLDSAIWAFKEGKKRGGFGKLRLELNKKVLDACSKNAILISSGDNSTIALWYLQTMRIKG